MTCLPYAEAEALAARAFLRAGVDERAARQGAEILVAAEAMGIGTHGLLRVRDYVQRIASGGIDGRAVAAMEYVAPALLRVDGAHGLGPAVVVDALQATMDVARQTGVAAAFIRRASHLGALAPYLLRAADAGFAAVITSNTAPMIAPSGGRAARIGNNPLGFAIPHGPGRHVILDMALSVVARSRVRAAARDGRAIPEDWAAGPDGRPTADPALALRGLMRAIGGDKGANLALCLDLMAGGLSGAAMLSEIPAAADDPARCQNLGQMILLVQADRLLPDAERKVRLDAAAAIIAATPPVAPENPVRLPGARALDHLRIAQIEGLEVPQALLSDLRALAACAPG